MSQQSVTALPPRAIIRSLAGLHAEQDGVLSIYIDLDLSLFPTPRDRQMEIDALIDQARNAFVTDGLSHAEREERKAAIERLDEELGPHELAKHKTRSRAIFVAPSADVFEVLDVGHPVAPTVVVDETPYLRPLANEAGPRTWAVLLVDRRNARLLYGGERRLVEIASFTDNTPSHQKQGGWSAERYQRHSDEAAKEHVEQATRKLFELWEQSPFDALALAAPEGTYQLAIDSLHPYLRERFKGRVNVEIEFPNAEQVLEAAKPVFDDARERALDDLLTVIDETSRERVVFGPPTVFEMLFERRVDTLVVEETFAMPGVRCHQCGWLGVNGESCPFDAIAVEHSPDVVDDAIDLALLQAAHVVVVDRDAQRHPPEPIVALLRY